jgi:hypothetical protein
MHAGAMGNNIGKAQNEACLGRWMGNLGPWLNEKTQGVSRDLSH